MNGRNYFLTLLVLIFIATSPQIAWSQMDPEEAYDPFIDYSEFDEASDEEADINFFRNGRFLTAGLAVGPQTFTQGMGKAYGDGPSMGLLLTYFFDLRLALTLGLMTSDRSVNIKTSGGDFTGTVSMSEINFHLKYYLSTQNMVKGLANLNPYFAGGFSQINRSYSIADLQESSKDSAVSTDVGFGIEIPMMRRKSFIAFQGLYHYVTFVDENKRNFNGQRLNHKIDGDFINWSFILGLNF